MKLFNLTRSAVAHCKGFAPLLVVISALTTGSVCRATVIADWTFETSLPASAGPFAPEIGAGAATGSHAGASVYSNPAGNGSAHSFSSNTWAVNDYYQFKVSTVGLQDVQVAWDQTSSNTGPRDFQFQYSTDGTNFTSIGGTYAVLANAAPNPVWNMATSSAIYNNTRDLSSIVALDNAANVYFRLIQVSTVSANGQAIQGAGTDRVDNFIITASPAVPEPSTFVLGGLGLLAGTVFTVRRRAARRSSRG